MAPTDDLEQEIDLALENIELRKREQALAQENQQLKGRVTQLEQQLQPFQKPKKKNFKRTVGILAAGVIGAAAVTAMGVYYFHYLKPNSSQAYRLQAVDSPIVPEAPIPIVPKPLNELLLAEFNFPVEIQVHDSSHWINEVQQQDIYVYDAGDYTLHLISNEGRTITRYNPPHMQRKQIEYTLGSGRTSFMFFDSSNNPVEGRWVNGMNVKVDNYDGTITTFSIPELEFVRREEGSLPSSLPSIVKNMPFFEKPEHYILLNDAPSRFYGNFDLFIELYGWRPKRQGLCNHMPTLTFSNQVQTIMGGYICDNGDLEKHVTIPYEKAGISEDTVNNIIDTEIYYDTLLLVVRGERKIKHIKLNF